MLPFCGADTADIPGGALTAEAPDADGETGRTATVMVYMTGSDLEASAAAATKDMEEMLEAGADLSRVELLVYTGARRSGTARSRGDVNALFRLTDTGFELLEIFEQLSMGDPKNLTRFLERGYRDHPADE